MEANILFGGRSQPAHVKPYFQVNRKIPIICDATVDCEIPSARHSSIYTITYLLTPWSRVLLEKLNGLQLVKKFPAFYGTRRFITPFTSAHHLSLSWASSIQSIRPHPTYWRSILILSSHLRLGLLRPHATLAIFTFAVITYDKWFFRLCKSFYSLSLTPNKTVKNRALTFVLTFVSK